MKYLRLLFLLVYLVSCSCSKRVVETPSQDIVEVKKTYNDNLIVKKKVLETNPDTIIQKNTEIKNKSGSIDKLEEFNEVPIKRSLPIHQLWDALLNKHVSEEGQVDYKSFKTDQDKLQDYINSLGPFYIDEDFKSLSREEILAFWINAYNAMTIDLILRHYPVKSIKDIKNPWEQRYWKLGEKWYNLDEIEHQILRKMEEPRIHFAIVCASVSCPKLLNEAYTASKLESQLTKAAREFLNDPKRNTISENQVEISKIFQWFTKDFIQDGSLVDFLNTYTNTTISEKAKITYKDYNWDLNE